MEGWSPGVGLISLGALTLARAATYFRREYTRGDYYIAGRTVGTGTWQGHAAQRLGLAGDVSPSDFAALLAGRSPTDGRQLVAPETASGTHRAAWDFQAAPDKSVSLVGGDERVIAAHLAAAATSSRSPPPPTATPPWSANSSPRRATP
jgi:conjugative relaxase-like TrwC/TraI family protein